METPSSSHRFKAEALPCKICGKPPRLETQPDAAKARTKVKLKCCGHWGAAVLEDRSVGFLSPGTAHTFRAGSFYFTVERT